LKYNCRLRILTNNILLITNSYILRKFIKEDFPSLPIKRKEKTSLKLICKLKNRADNKEALLELLKIEDKILEKAKKKYLIFHASAFSYKNHATIALGDSGSGKSSLCFAAGLCRAKIISDEPVLVDKKTLKVTPFRYLLKIENFYRNFSKWPLPPAAHQNRFIKNGCFDFNIFTKNSLKTLGIKVENNALPLKNIVFLEHKRYDPLLHLFKHCLNNDEKAKKLLIALNLLIRKKNIQFIPEIVHILTDKGKVKNILKGLAATD
jgi:hypothetical protein